MDHFSYRDGTLFAEDVNLQQLATDCGTPCYVYSRATLERHWHAFDDAFGDHPHLICYAVKANPNIAVLDVLARLGSGFDVVSVGEIERVLRAGGSADRIVFSGVGKRVDEIERALEVGIRCFNVESEAELFAIDQVARDMGKTAPVSLRVNPDVDAITHPYISTGLKENKFGIAIEAAAAVYAKAAAMSGVDVVGIDCHIGSQLTQIEPFIDSIERVLLLVDELAANGIALHHIDVGGGLGVSYRDEQPPSPAEWAAALVDRLQDRQLEVMIEPGRAIAANAGVLLTEVLYLKHNEHRNFAIIDAAMNDLMRPSLYGAWQAIEHVDATANERDIELKEYDIVGPVCESGDFLGKDREMRLAANDLLAIRSSGAYGFSMSSNYNTRQRAAEIMVDGDAWQIVRRRESMASLFADERLLGESVDD